MGEEPLPGEARGPRMSSEMAGEAPDGAESHGKGGQSCPGASALHQPCSCHVPEVDPFNPHRRELGHPGRAYLAPTSTFQRVSAPSLIAADNLLS